MNWYLQPWKKFADFSGRARRLEYWTFTLLNSLIYAVLVLIEGGIRGYTEPTFFVLPLIFGLATLIPQLAAAVRRLHDTGRSGFWVLLALVPVLNLILLIFFLFNSQPGTNQYGPNPKGVEAVEGAQANPTV